MVSNYLFQGLTDLQILDKPTGHDVRAEIRIDDLGERYEHVLLRVIHGGHGGASWRIKPNDNIFLKKTETRTAPRGASAGRFPNEEKLTTGRRWPRHASTAPAGAVRRGEPPVRHRGKSSSVCWERERECAQEPNHRVHQYGALEQGRRRYDAERERHFTSRGWWRRCAEELGSGRHEKGGGRGAEGLHRRPDKDCPRSPGACRWRSVAATSWWGETAVAASGEVRRRRCRGGGRLRSRAAGAHCHPQNRGRAEEKDNTRGDKDWIGVLSACRRHENVRDLKKKMYTKCLK